MVLFLLAVVDRGDLLAHGRRVRPLLLIFVELLQVHERVAILRIQPHDFLKGLERPVDEAAMLVVETQAEQDVGVFDRPEVGPLQQPLMNRDRSPDLSFLAIQVAENHLDLERVGLGAGGACQFIDGLIDLVVNEAVETQHVVRRLTKTAAIDPATVAQLVPLPGLAHDQAQQQRKQHGKQGVVTHGA